MKNAWLYTCTQAPTYIRTHVHTVICTFIHIYIILYIFRDRVITRLLLIKPQAQTLLVFYVLKGSIFHLFSELL